MKTLFHAVLAFLGLAIITTFFLASIVVELVGDEASIAAVKQLIVYGLFVLVPVLIATTVSGRAVIGSRKGRLIDTKMKRMIVIALNGLLILVPCAVVLNRLAISGNLGTMFYSLQGIELLAGATNITLIGMNIRDGFLLSGRLRKKRVFTS